MSQIRLAEGTVPSAPGGASRVLFASSDGIYALDSAGGTTKFGAAGAGGGIAASGGTQVVTSGTLVFSNSNGLTFGISNSSVLTASHNGLTTAALSNHSHGNPTLNLTNLSGTTASNSAGFTLSLSAAAGGGGADGYNILAAGTQTAATTGTVVFSNSNGISFGMSNSSIITASYTVPSTAGLLSAVNVSAGTTSNNLSALTLSNSNGLTFGLNGSVITASHNGLTTQSVQTQSNVQGLSAGTQVGRTGDIVFADSNGISFGLSGSSRVTATYTVPSVAGLLSAINVSAGTTSNNLSALTFSNSNGLTFGLNGSVVTASHNGLTTQTVQTQSNVQGVIVSNTTYRTGDVSFSNANGISFGSSAGQAITASYTVPSTAGLISAINVSAGTTSNNLSAVTFSNSNGVSFGLNGSVVTASVAAAGGAQTGISGIANSETTYTSGSVTFSALGAITIRSTTGQQFQFSVNSQTAQTQSVVQGISAGTQVGQTGNIVFSNSNGISFGMSNSSVVTASYTVPSTAGLLSAVNVSAGTTSNNLSALTFNNANGVTFGLNASTLTASHNGLTTARASNDGVGLATAQTNVTWTVNSAGLSLNAAGYAGTGTTFNGTNISGSMTLNSAGLRLDASVAAPGGGGAINFSAGTTSNNLQTVVFSNSNGVSFGLNGSTVTASVDAAGGGSTLSYYHLVKNTGMSNASYAIGTTTSSPVSVFPVSVESNVSAGIMNIVVSMNFTTLGTSSGQRSYGLWMGISSRGTGTNSTTMGSVTSASFSIGVTGNNSTYTINQPTSTAYTGYATGSTSSAGSNITSQYTGNKVIGFPVNTLLTPGQYWVGFLATFSTSSVNVGVLMSMYGAQAPSQMAVAAPIGSLSSAYSRDPTYVAAFNPGQGSWSSAGSVTQLPASIAFTSISKVMSAHPYMVFWRT